MVNLPWSLRSDGFFPATTFVVKPFCQAQEHHHEYQGDTDNNHNWKKKLMNWLIFMKKVRLG